MPEARLDTTTPSGKALFQMCGVFAEFERSIISERVKAGLHRAIHQGKTLGRPKTSIDVSAIVADRKAGLSIRKVAAKYGISVGTAYNVLKELE